MTKPFQFIGPEFERSWSISNFDPHQLSRLENFLSRTSASLDGALPTTVVITDKGEPIDVMVEEDRLYLNVHAVDHYGESILTAVLAHEAAHIKFGDGKLRNALHNIGRCLSGVKHLHAVFSESPSSCCGLILEKFGNVDAFAGTLQQAATTTHKVREFFSGLGIEPETDPAILAHRMIADEGVQRSLVSLNDELVSGKIGETTEFLDTFFAQTIAARRDRAGWHSAFVDYEALLPKDEARDDLIGKLSELHQVYVVPTQEKFQEIDAIGTILLKAAEHRADYEMYSKCGVKAAKGVIDFIRRHCEKLSSEERLALETQMAIDHPSFEQREDFFTNCEATHLASLRPVQGNANRVNGYARLGCRPA